MAYTNFINCTKQQYTNIIYSQEDINRIRIWFNNVEFIDAGEYCVSLTGTNRILPTDGSKRFTLSNFIAKEYDLVLRDVPQEVIIQDQVKISIGTVVDIEYVATSDETYQVSKEYYTYSNNTYTLLVAGTDYQIGAEITGTVYETSDIYEDVPIGIFNIQDTPTTNNNQITIKLRDNRVKFDFNYNAQPLIEQSGGSATLGAILNDMCTKAGVTNDVSSFAGDNIAVAIYDGTIKATNYVGYIAEQAGAIPVITREGHLDFIYLDNLQTWQIPLDIVEKYELGTPYQIERVVYESGTIKYETSSDITLDTLYLDSSNMYITTQAQVNTVFGIVEDFELDSALTGKVLGNPAIDSYDIIEIYGYYTEDEDGNATFVADTNTIVLRTLANNTYNYSGVSTNTFETQIGKEERKENVLKSGDESFKAWARSEIDNINVQITQTVGRVGTLEDDMYGDYILTKDTRFEQYKTYYTLVNNNYEAVDMYYLTEDSSYRAGKTYYIKDNDNYIVYPRYFLTSDTVFQSGKTYYHIVNGVWVAYDSSYIGQDIPADTVYEKNYDYGDTIPSNTIYETLIGKTIPENTYYELDGVITALQEADFKINEQGLKLDLKTSKIDDNGNATSFETNGYDENNNISSSIIYTMDSNGFITDDKRTGFKVVRSSTGDYYYENNIMIGKYTKDGSVQKDLALFGKYYYGIDDETINVENFKKDDAMFLAQMYTFDDGQGNTEDGFGHFYNGS